jgi:hypothetical protein
VPPAGFKLAKKDAERFIGVAQCVLDAFDLCSLAGSPIQSFIGDVFQEITSTIELLARAWFEFIVDASFQADNSASKAAAFCCNQFELSLMQKDSGFAEIVNEISQLQPMCGAFCRQSRIIRRMLCAASADRCPDS